MESNLKIFENAEFGAIRTIEINNEPWIMASDVCKIFGVTNGRNITARLDEDEKDVYTVDTPGGKQNVTFVNESGLYNMLLSMNPSKAKARGISDSEIANRQDQLKRFKRWITHEVLPSIRRNGVYATTDFISKALDDPDFAIKMLQKLKEERAENKRLQETVAVQTQQIAEMQPKVSYYDVVLQTPDALPISVIAKDYGWSAQKLNQELRTRHVQYQQGRIWLLYQEHAEQGYTVTKTSLVEDGAGNQHSRVHTYWTQKGRLFIYDLLKKDGILPLIEREEAAA